MSRKDLDIDQQELGRRAGVSNTYISNIERGHAKNVTADVLVKLSQALHVSIPYLLGLTDVPGTADDGAPVDASGAHITFEVRDPELRTILVELADLLHGMTPAQRRYFAEQVRLMRRLMDDEDSRAKNPIIIG